MFLEILAQQNHKIIQNLISNKKTQVAKSVQIK